MNMELRLGHVESVEGHLSSFVVCEISASVKR